MAISIVSQYGYPYSSNSTSINQSSFGWTFPNDTSSATGLLVYTFNNSSTNDDVTAITYDGQSLTPITDGRAINADLPGDVKTWYSQNTPSNFTLEGSRPLSVGAFYGTRIESGNGYLVTPHYTGSGNGIYYIAGNTLVNPVRVDVSAAAADGGNYLPSVSYGNNTWVVGGYNLILVSTDATPLSWSKPTSSWTGTGYIWDIANDGTTFVAVGQNGSMGYSSNPRTSWTVTTIAAAQGVSIRAVDYANGYWVAVTEGGRILYTTDPSLTWNVATSNTINALYEVKYINGQWFAVGSSGTMRYATNPFDSWSTVTTTTTASLFGIEYFNGYWVVTSNGSTTIYSTSLSGPWTTVVPGTGSRPFIFNNQLYTKYDSYFGGYQYYVSTFCPALKVTRNNNSNEIWAHGFALSGNIPTPQAVSAIQTTGTLTQTTVDASNVADSLRFAGINSKLDEYPNYSGIGILTTGENSTNIASKYKTLSTQNYYPSSGTTLSTTVPSSGTVSSGNTNSSSLTVTKTFLITGLSANAIVPGIWTGQLSLTSNTTYPEHYNEFRVERRNSAGVTQASTYLTSFYSYNGTNNYGISNSINLGTWAAGDQMALVWSHSKYSGSGQKASTLNIGSSTFINAPTDNRVSALVRETTSGTGSRPVGFTSTTSEPYALVTLAITEYSNAAQILAPVATATSLSLVSVPKQSLFPNVAIATATANVLVVRAVQKFPSSTATASALVTTTKSQYLLRAPPTNALGDTYIADISITALAFIVPSADITVGSWEPTPLYEKIDDIKNNSNDSIYTNVDGNSNIFEVKLSTLPSISEKNKMRVVYKVKPLYLNSKVTVTLLEDSTVIASWTDQIGDSFIQHYLTQVQMDAIISINNLRLRFEAVSL